MRLFEIPFQPDPAGIWSISNVDDDDEHQFMSRDKALSYALSLAIKDRRCGRGNGLLCIQGADGQWRMFTPDLLPAEYGDRYS